MKISELGEIGLIKRISGTVSADSSVVKGIGDDAAVIRWTAGKYLLYTCDMLVEDVHFTRRAATPFQIGWKAIGRNISDIAAMGGVPRYALVSAAMDPELPVSFADGIYKGIKALSRKFGVSIVGGDTCRSGKIAIDISMIGQVEKKNLVARSGAKPGDLIFVTGSIGGSGGGRHLNFTPRAEEARALVKMFKLSSMIDVTDGLLIDLKRVLTASRVGARLYKAFVPVSRRTVSFDSAVSEGEDFELLFTMSRREAARLGVTVPGMRTAVTMIGEVTGIRDGLMIVAKDGTWRKAEAEGYLHF